MHVLGLIGLIIGFMLIIWAEIDDLWRDHNLSKITVLILGIIFIFCGVCFLAYQFSIFSAAAPIS